MSIQQTLAGDTRPVEIDCEAHGNECTQPAEMIISVRCGAADMEMAVCENCRNVIVGHCDEFYGERELTEPEAFRRAETAPSRRDS